MNPTTPVALRVTKHEIIERETHVIELNDELKNLLERREIYGSGDSDCEGTLSVNAACLLYTVADLLSELGFRGLGPNTIEAVQTVREIAKRRNGRD